MKVLNVGSLVILSVLIYSCKNDRGPLPEAAVAGECDTIVYYTDDIKPIMAAKCATSGCHEPGFSSGDLTQYNPLKTMIVNETFEDRVFDIQDMPPAGNELLTEAEKKKIKCWIKQGYPNNSKDASLGSSACSVTISYASDITPIISANCSGATVCHGTGSSNGDYSGYSGLKVDADNGILYDRVITKNSLHAPPVVVNPPLTAAQMSKIDCWIQQGAADN